MGKEPNLNFREMECIGMRTLYYSALNSHDQQIAVYEVFLAECFD